MTHRAFQRTRSDLQRRSGRKIGASQSWGFRKITNLMPYFDESGAIPGPKTAKQKPKLLYFASEQEISNFLWVYARRARSWSTRTKTAPIRHDLAWPNPYRAIRLHPDAIAALKALLSSTNGRFRFLSVFYARKARSRDKNKRYVPQSCTIAIRGDKSEKMKIQKKDDGWKTHIFSS